MHRVQHVGDVRIHFRRVAEPFVDLGEAADRGEVLGRGSEDGLELLARRVVVAGFDQRAAERDARGQVGGMALEAGAAGLDRLVVAADAAELFGERRKRDRRRVREDPASQFLYPRIFRHSTTLPLASRVTVIVL